ERRPGAIDARQNVVVELRGQRRVRCTTVFEVLGLQGEAGLGDALDDIVHRLADRRRHGTLALCHHASTLYVFPARHQLARRISTELPRARRGDRKSTRLNASHVTISYAVFCLKKT